MIVACPDLEVLCRLLLGQISGEELEAIAIHVETCASCVQQLHKLHASDPLLDAMQNAASAPLGSDDALIHQWMQQHLAALVDTATQSSSKADVAASADENSEDFPELASPEQPDEIGRLADYRILEVLGSGGMGIVFRAEDVRLKRAVALKIMKREVAATESARDRFLREAQSAAGLEHENIVTIHQVGEARGVPFIAMQWLKGISLDDRLRQGSRLSIVEATQIGRQAARGLAAAHAHGVIHRDIKPANIWLEDVASETGDRVQRVKILDFGLARESTSEIQLTQSGAVVGTPAYMAPEQAQGEPVDPRADLFSLGVVLYLLVTGRRPFAGRNALEVLHSLANRTPDSPQSINAEVPPELSELIMELLEKDPAKRPATARVVADRMQAIERQGCPVARSRSNPSRVRTPAAPRPRPAGWRMKPLVTAGLALLALLGGFATYQLLFKSLDSTPIVEVDVNADVRQRVIAQWLVRHNCQLAVKPTDWRPAFEVTRLEQLPETPFQVQAVVALQEAWHDEHLEQLASLTGLQSLVVTSSDITDAAVEKFTQSPCAAHLRVVHISTSEITDVGLAHFGRCPELVSLTQQLSKVSDRCLDDLECRDKLRSLGIGSRNLTDAAVDGIERFPSLAALMIISPKITDAVPAKLVGMNLIDLRLGSPEVTSVGMRHVKKLTNLRFLGLWGTGVDDAGLEELADLPELETLSFSGTVAELGIQQRKLTNAGLKPLARFPKLRQLYLDYLGISDDGLVDLAQARRLEFLSLRLSEVTDDGLPHLTALTGLKELNLTGAKVTAEGVKELAAALPGCNIVWDGGIELSKSAAGS